MASAPAALTTSQAISNVNAFAFSLFNQLARTNRDVFISPVSIVAALGMLMAATTPHGTVERELKNMLKCGEKDISGLLDNVFTDTKSDKMQLLMANSVWTSKVKNGFKASMLKSSQDLPAQALSTNGSISPLQE
jgi:serine protease inhibitor